MLKNSAQPFQHLLCLQQAQSTQPARNLKARWVGMGEDSHFPSGVPLSFQATPKSIRKWCLMMGREARTILAFGLLRCAGYIINIIFKIPRLLTICICICMHAYLQIYLFDFARQAQQRMCSKKILAASQVFSTPSEA